MLNVILVVVVSRVVELVDELVVVIEVISLLKNENNYMCFEIKKKSIKN